MIILFKYCADVKNCGSFRGFGFIYIYIYNLANPTSHLVVTTSPPLKNVDFFDLM